jgi:hypothetical protein
MPSSSDCRSSCIDAEEFSNLVFAILRLRQRIWILENGAFPPRLPFRLMSVWQPPSQPLRQAVFPLPFSRGALSSLFFLCSCHFFFSRISLSLCNHSSSSFLAFSSASRFVSSSLHCHSSSPPARRASRSSDSLINRSASPFNRSSFLSRSSSSASSQPLVSYVPPLPSAYVQRPLSLSLPFLCFSFQFGFLLFSCSSSARRKFR